MANHECPICGHASSTEKRLVRHVAKKHLKADPLWDDGQECAFYCWCGLVRWLDADEYPGGDLLQHFREFGGVRLHFLACSLGV